MAKTKGKDAGKNDERIRKSLKYSVLDGSFYSSMVGFGESFFSAFATFLNATNFQLGILGSLPQALGSIAQLNSNRLIKLFNSRKRMVCLFAFLQALMFVPIALVFFLGTMQVYHLIIFVSLYWIFASIGSPAWNSWMGDLVDEKARGAYFGRRNRIAGLVTVVTLFIAGFILQQFVADKTAQYVGFVIIFSFALVSRIISFAYLTKKYDPPFRVTRRSEFSFLDFVRKARFTNYGLFVIFLSLFNFSAFIAGPFFVPYWLYDLKLTWIQFTIIFSVQLFVKFLFMPLWGKACDRFGTRRVLSLNAFLVSTLAILWIFSTNFWYMICIQVFSGFVWAGFEIASFNFIFDTTTREKRATCVAYYNVINGIFMLAGSLFGILLISYTDFFWSRYYIVFIVSAIARFLVALYFIPKLKEARTVEHISNKDLIYSVTQPTLSTIYDIMTFIPSETGKHLSNIGIIEKKKSIVKGKSKRSIRNNKNNRS